MGIQPQTRFEACLGLIRYADPYNHYRYFRRIGRRCLDILCALSKGQTAGGRISLALSAVFHIVRNLYLVLVDAC